MTRVHSDAVGVSIPGGDEATLSPALERAVMAVDEVTSGELSPDQCSRIVRAALLAVRVADPVYMIEARFNDRIDAILFDGA